MIRFCLCFILLSLIACAKEEQVTSFKRVPIQSKDIIYRVDIDENDFTTIVGSYVWSHAFSISTNNIKENAVKDSFSNKGIFDLLRTKNHKLVCVGTDGYLFEKEDVQAKWNFVRLSEWDILNSVIETEDGFMAAGGKSYETGNIYLLNHQFSIDTVLRFGHEISEIVRIDINKYVSLGYGNIMVSKNAGLDWKLLSNKGDFYASCVFLDDKRGFMVGYNGSLLISTNEGETWEKSNANIRGNGFNSFRKIKKLIDGELIIVGNNGKIWRSLDTGQNWELFKLPTSSDIYDIAKKNTGNYIVVGSNGLVAEIRF